MKRTLQKIQLLVASFMVVMGVATVLAPVATYAACDAPASDAERELCAAAASQERKKAACEGAAAAGVTDCENSDAAKTSFKNIVGTVINILSVVVGAVSVIMIIVGGFRYVVSNGDSNAMSGAKSTILYAIVGLVIVLFAQIIVAFVIDRATAF